LKNFIHFTFAKLILIVENTSTASLIPQKQEFLKQKNVIEVYPD